MKKIGIVTFHSAHNYGAMLQTVALQKTLDQYDTKIINYRNKNIDDEYKVFKLKKSKNLFRVLKNLIGQVFYIKKSAERFEKFDEFMNNKLNLTNAFYSEEDLKNNPPNMDIYITGSDQVWNVDITKGLSEIYTLNFGGNNIRRIAYAASIGNDNISQNTEEYKERISKIDYISVRENNAKQELSKYINKNVEVTLDPTLLIKREEWDNMLDSEPLKNEKYILCYAPKVDEEYLKIANYLSEMTGLKVVHFERRDKNYNNVLMNAYTTGPLDFVNLIKNAEYVVTTSFHAVVFSIIFNKRFFVIPHRKTGSRVTNLIEKLDIENRMFYNFHDFKDIDYKFNTNWEKAEKILEKEREKSITWLKNAIEH